MNMHRKLVALRAARWAGRLRGLPTLLGAYLWMLSALLSSTAAHADDIDIYTKAGVDAGGSVISIVANTAKSTACSLLDANCKASTPGRYTNTLLNQINYNMIDALRAVATSAPKTALINITDYANNGSYDVGHIHQEQILIGKITSTTGASTPVSPIDVRISASVNDAVQRPTGSVSLTDDLYIGILPGGTSPYGSSIAGAWTSSGGAGLGGTAADGIVDAVVDATKWQNAPANGNKVYYYKHTAATTTQSFYLDATLDVTTNAVLFLIDQTAPTVVKQLNDDRYYDAVCPAGTTPQTTGPNAGKCKVSGSTFVSKIVTIDKDSTINATGMVQDRFYKLVVATRDPAKADTFTLQMGDSTLGQFWDTDTPAAAGTLQSSGFYFPNISIPPDADITSAKLVFNKADSLTGSGILTSTVVSIDQNVAPKDFSVKDLNTRSWETNDSDGFDWNVTGANPEIDVTDLVDDQVARDGWCTGQGLAFKVSRAVGSAWFMKATSFETNPSNSARLVITWDTTTGDAAACETNRMLSLKVGAMSEDVNQFADGTMDIHKDKMPDTITATAIDERANLWLSSKTKVGLRFPLVQVQRGPIPKIISAKLRLTATSGSPQQLLVSGILNKKGTAEAFFLDDFHLNSLTTTAELPWNFATWTPGTVYESGNLASIVQAQIDQANWSNENTLGFVIRGTSETVTKACSWERNSTGGLIGTDRNAVGEFGHCAAELILEIDDNGTLVQETGRRTLVQHIMALPMSGLQPMGEAYLKNARYMAGKFNLAPAFSSDSVADDGTLDTAPVQPTLADGECNSNTLVYIADNNEDATLDPTLDDRYAAFASSVGGSTSCSLSGVSAKSCVIDTAGILFNGFNPEGPVEKAVMRTFTVNFGATAGGSGGGEGAVDWTQSDPGSGTLRSVAAQGGGAAKQASSSAQLVKQLLALIQLVSDSGASVAAPGISVNALNRFEHLDQLYYSLFKPSTRVDWTGNLKRYQLLDSEVADAKGNVAVTTASNAFFVPDAHSFWNGGDPDGSDVTIGGAAAKNLGSERRIYTYLGSNSAVSDLELTEMIEDSNTNLDEVVLGMDQASMPAEYVTGGSLETQLQRDARRSEIISWLRSTPSDSSELRWAASIHNSPRIVAFDSSLTKPVITVFYGDNRGMLHAINAGPYTSIDPAVNMDTAAGGGQAGKELFAFLPQELLKNAGVLNQNTQSITGPDGYIYGLDGDFTLLRDLDENRAVKRVLLFAGMRRGGDNYYGVDVSKARADILDPDERVPKLKWVIDGGVGDYAAMGETWSGMSPNKIAWPSFPDGKRTVLVFGGGHDSSRHDDGKYDVDMTKEATTPYTFVPLAAGTSEKGGVLYFADPETGKRVWASTQLNTALPKYAAALKMKYSIVATPRLIDRNGDGAYDAIYVVDLAGQVFRFDLNKDAAGPGTVIRRVTLVASLGALGSQGDLSPPATDESAVNSTADLKFDNRRFYDSPSVAYLGKDVLLALSSGYREEPTSSTTQETFFFIKDKGAFSATPPIDPPVITLDKLDNITGNAVTEPADGTRIGWYYNFDKSRGEKGIGSPVIFNTAILWTTYLVLEGASKCVPDIGSTRLYLVDFLGRGMADADGDGAGTDAGRYLDINLPGLADTPQLIFREGGGIDVAVGVRVNAGEDLCVPGVNCPFDTSAFGKLRRSRWYMVDED